MVALIVLAVIAFLALDAWIFYRVFIRGRRTAAAYGAVSVSGETEVVLQPGRVKVTYQESKSSTVVVNDEEFDVPAVLEVTVVAPSGQPVSLKGPGIRGMGSSTSTGAGRSQALVGTFEATESGMYTVTAAGELSHAAEPQVLIGH
jgi:hypothetical protein